MNEKVLVTGLGVVSSIGVGKDQFWKNLLAGCSGIKEVSLFDTAAYRCHRAGEILDFVAPLSLTDEKVLRMSRVSQFAVTGTALALDDAGLDLADISGKNAAVFMGTTMTAGHLLDSCTSRFIQGKCDDVEPGMLINAYSSCIPQSIGAYFGIRGHNVLLPNACAAGNFALAYGYDLIKKGKVDIVIAGGAESLSRVAFAGFQRLRAMSPDACSPFDKNRKGMLLGEGAGIIVLESGSSAKKRGASAYAEISGYGISCDAYHITIPDKSGIKKAIKKALVNSELSAADIDYISAHGTGTPANDKTESQAVREIFDGYAVPPVSSIKSMLGHCMGASSAIEAIACCLAIRDQVVPPTINFQDPDSECEVDCVANKCRQLEVNRVMNNGFAFGGNNSCVVFSRF